MDLSQIKSVIHLYRHDAVNKYLKAGWEIIAINPYADGPEIQGTQYVLAWSSESTPVHPSLMPDYGDDPDIPNW